MAVTKATEIGGKYGESVVDFQKNNETALEKVMLLWVNDSIGIMRSIIQKKTKTGTGSTLAQDLDPMGYKKPNSVGARIITRSDYYDFVDKGVIGLTKNKAPNSPYRFKNLYTPPKMIESFKRWAAAAGIKSVGNRTLSFKGKKREKALDDQTKVAKQLAVFTKLGGIKPVNYIEPAVGNRRVKILATELTKVMKGNIIKAIKK